MNTTKITCSRCKGKGVLVGHHVIYCGVPGGCYKCALKGEVYKDKFAGRFADEKGDFYGCTHTYRHGGQVKSVGRFTAETLETADKSWTYTKITEEQAERFYRRYGDSTSVNWPQ